MPQNEHQPIHFLDQTALAMLKSDIDELKQMLREYQQETKGEFQRLRDKLDNTKDQVAEESKIAAVAIKALETEQKHTASVYGAVAGTLGAIVVAIVGALARWAFGQIG